MATDPDNEVLAADHDACDDDDAAEAYDPPLLDSPLPATPPGWLPEQIIPLDAPPELWRELTLGAGGSLETNGIRPNRTSSCHPE